MGSVLAGLILTCTCMAQVQETHAPDQGDILKKFLREYVRDPYYDYKTTRYFAAFVNLRDDGPQQVIVYFTDRRSCGSSGCTTLILSPEGSSYKVVTSIPAARPPIRILDTKSNGWLLRLIEGG
jgi:hypothetical protein